MSLFQPAPKPASLLGYHRVLAPTAGVKVSPLCLGAMNFGSAWFVSLLRDFDRSIAAAKIFISDREEFMGECGKEQSFAVLDAFYDLGGNFIDT